MPVFGGKKSRHQLLKVCFSFGTSSSNIQLRLAVVWIVWGLHIIFSIVSESSNFARYFFFKTPMKDDFIFTESVFVVRRKKVWRWSKMLLRQLLGCTKAVTWTGSVWVNFLGPVVFSGTFCKRLLVFCSEDSSTLSRMFYGAFGMYDKGCIGIKCILFGLWLLRSKSLFEVYWSTWNSDAEEIHKQKD